MKRALFALAMVLGLATAILRAQVITPLASLNCTSANWPNCNAPWGNWTNLTYIDMTRVGNGGRFVMKHNVPAFQPYMGWSTTLASTASSLFIRFRLTINPPYKGDGVGDVWSSKFVIVNDGGDSSIRAIAEIKPRMRADNTDFWFTWKRNIEGPGDVSWSAVELTPLIGTRIDMQLEVTRGANGRTAIWVNNNNCAAPTAASQRFNFAPTGWSAVGVGFYNNMTVGGSGNVDLTIQDVVIDDACDPNWAGGSTPTGPPAPLIPVRTAVPS